MDDTPLAAQQPGSHTRQRIVVIAILLVFLGAISFFLWLYSYSVTPGPSGPATVTIIIPKGSSFADIRKILVDGGVINEDVRFDLLARMYGVAGKVRAGEFALQTSQRPLDILQELTTATSIQHRITIAEGLNAAEIAARFAKGNWCSAEDFLKLVKERAFLDSLGFTSIDSLEGYLYPDTYYLTRVPEIDAAEIIRKMVRRFEHIWQEIASEGVARHEVVTLASIVEKETGEPSERPRIASVFRNRLKRGMKLQSDPTVIYGVADFTGKITKKNLQTPSPYNTYVIKGLPAGPISNPGKDAMHAVLNPADEEYLYFVSKNEGTHYFSTTLREHNRAVRKYQRSQN